MGKVIKKGLMKKGDPKLYLSSGIKPIMIFPNNKKKEKGNG